jgi:hypothetical protein
MIILSFVLTVEYDCLPTNVWDNDLVFMLRIAFYLNGEFQSIQTGEDYTHFDATKNLSANFSCLSADF